MGVPSTSATSYPQDAHFGTLNQDAIGGQPHWPTFKWRRLLLKDIGLLHILQERLGSVSGSVLVGDAGLEWTPPYSSPSPSSSRSRERKRSYGSRHYRRCSNSPHQRFPSPSSLGDRIRKMVAETLAESLPKLLTTNLSQEQKAVLHTASVSPRVTASSSIPPPHCERAEALPYNPYIMPGSH